MPSTARKVSKRSSTPTGAYTRATASRTRSETVRPCLRASDLRRWCTSSSRYSWVRCMCDVYTSMYIHCQSKAMRFSGQCFRWPRKTTETLPHTYQWCFPPPLTEFVAENRLLTSSGWVGGTKVPGEGRRSVLSVLSVAKTETRPESSRPSSQRHASRLNRLLSCHPAPHRIGYRRLGADAALAGPSPAQHFHPSTRISNTAGGAVTPCRGT